MNLNAATRDELASHTAEIISSQDDKILALIQERKVLWILLGISVTFQLVFG